MRRVFPWSTLGIDADSDEAAVRRAYAKKLKAMDPDADHKGFERLRDARDRALVLARSRAAGAVEEEEDEDWLAKDDGDDQWQAGSRDYDDDDLPVADDSTHSATPIAPYGGIYVDVLRGDEQSEPPPVVAADGEAALSVPAPAIDADFAIPPVGLAFSPVATGSGETLADNPFPVVPPVLGSSIDIGDTVTPSALTRTVDGTIATSQDSIYRLLLEADPQAWLTADEEAVIHRHLDVILGDDRMGEIGFAADMENWLATVFARSTPRSHPFVQRLADHFGWRADAGNINQPHSIAWLADRALAFDFRDKVTQPSNNGYRAWIELSTPGKKRGGTRYVRELLTTIRTKHPVLEAELDWHKVSLWDVGGSTGGGSGYSGSADGTNWAVWIVPGFFLLAALGRCADGSQSTGRSDTPSGPDYSYSDSASGDTPQMRAVQNAEFDDADRRQVTIDDVLRKVVGSDYSADTLQDANPTLYGILDAKLIDLRSTRDALEDAEPDLEALLHRRIRGSISTVPYSLLVRWRGTQSDVLKGLAESSPQRCVDFLLGQPLSGAVAVADGADAYRQASLAMLLGGSTEATEGDGRVEFRARETTLEDAASRAGMSVEQWQRIYSSDSGQDRDYCIVNASIIDAAIAAPREESDRVLRDL